MKPVMLLSLALSGCFLFRVDPPPPAPDPVPCVESHVIPDFMVMEAAQRYDHGEPSEDSEMGRSAFRKVCLGQQDYRETVLAGLYDHAREHSAMWHSWYATNCMGSLMAVDKETGEPSAGFVCEAEAGAPPARLYVQTNEEVMARKQRRNCEGAQ